MAAEPPRSMAGHEHGVAQINIAHDGQHLELYLRLSAIDLYGFIPATGQDVSTQDAKRMSANAVLDLPCTSKSTMVSTVVQDDHEHHHDDHHDDEEHHDDKHHDDKHHDDDHHDDEKHHDDKHHNDQPKHRDIELTQHFSCDDPAAFSQIPVVIGQWLPLLERIHVEAITPTQAISQTFTTGTFILALD